MVRSLLLHLGDAISRTIDKIGRSQNDRSLLFVILTASSIRIIRFHYSGTEIDYKSYWIQQQALDSLNTWILLDRPRTGLPYTTGSPHWLNLRLSTILTQNFWARRLGFVPTGSIDKICSRQWCGVHKIRPNFIGYRSSILIDHNRLELINSGVRFHFVALSATLCLSIPNTKTHIPSVFSPGSFLLYFSLFYNFLHRPVWNFTHLSDAPCGCFFFTWQLINRWLFLKSVLFFCMIVHNYFLPNRIELWSHFMKLPANHWAMRCVLLLLSDSN